MKLSTFADYLSGSTIDESKSSSLIYRFLDINFNPYHRLVLYVCFVAFAL